MRRYLSVVIYSPEGDPYASFAVWIHNSECGGYYDDSYHQDLKSTIKDYDKRGV